MATFINVFSRSGHKYGSKVLRHLRTSRSFCSGTSGGSDAANINSIPLSQPVPWLAAPTYSNSASKKVHTQITQLENGMRVATEPNFGQFTTVGVLIDSGSRYESPYHSGITHFMEKLAFGATTKFENRDSILQTLEKHSGLCDCQGSRDTLIYALHADNRGLPEVIDLLSEVVLRPKITSEELEVCRQAILFDIETLEMRPDPEPLLVEMIHAAAYSNNTLGLPKISPEENIMKIDRSELYTFMNNYHTPDRIVLAGVGVDHNQLVDLARKGFMEKSPIWEEETDLIRKSPRKDLSISQYTGGLVKLEKDLSNISPGTPMPDLCHCVIALESCGHSDDDFIAYCVLNMLLGGGGSFSAGGPGKGMYTRLYLNVLNRFHWMYSATAYNHAYADSGLFCIHASSDPSQLRDLVEVIVRELVNTQHSINSNELHRAKTQLQSMLLMNLESRAVTMEDVGRQVLATNKRLNAEHFFDEIAKVRDSDVQRVARRMLASKPSVAAYGNTSQLPKFEDIEAGLLQKDGKMSKNRMFNFFR